MRSIDADELLKDEHQHYDYLSDEYYVLVKDIESAPTIELNKGTWIKMDDDGLAFKCSACGEISCCAGNYCTDCGAKMDEKE